MTEFKRVYFGTVLGYLWSLIRPLMLFGVLLFVFTQVFQVGSEQVEHYPVYAADGDRPLHLLPGSDDQRGDLGRRPGGRGPQDPVPAPGDPAVDRRSPALFNLGLNLVIVLVFLLAFGVDPAWTWLLFPFAVVVLFVLTAAVGMALSVLYVRFRDVAIIWVVVAQVLLYATPILYPVDFKANTTFEHLLMINPLAVIFEQVRVWVLAEPDAPDRGRAAGGWLGLLPAAAIFVGVCAFGAWYLQARGAAHRRGPLVRALGKLARDGRADRTDSASRRTPDADLRGSWRGATRRSSGCAIC